MLTYESSHKCFPGYANWIGANQTIPGSWVVSLLPFLEKTDMYNLWAGYNPSATPPNTFAFNQTANNILTNPYMKLLVCPSDSPDSTNQAWCSYVCNRGCNGWNYAYLGVCMDQAMPATSASVTGPAVQVSLDYVSSHDGSTTTLLLAESLLDYPTNTTQQPLVPRQDFNSSNANASLWTTPASVTGSSAPAVGSTVPATAILTPATSLYVGTTAPQNASNAMEAGVGFEWGQWSASPKLSDKLLSRHPGGVNVAFCDGHMAFLADSIDVNTFMMLMTPYGNGIGMATTTTMTKIVPYVTTQGTAPGTVALPTVPQQGSTLDESKF